MPSTATVEQLLLQHRIEQFLYREATLLDEHRYDEWLALMAPEIEYRMLRRTHVETRAQRDAKWPVGTAVALFDETLGSLQMRVRRLRDPGAWAEQPRSHVRHNISNVVVRELGDELEVLSNFAAYRARGSSTSDVFFGSRVDRLVPVADEWQIRQRTIMLEQNVLSAHNISMFF